MRHRKRGGKSLRRQLLDVNHSCYHPGRSKHIEKSTRPGEWQDGTIFSVQTKRNRDQIAEQLGAFIKSEFPDIKRVVDIRAEHVQAFLSVKAIEGGCTQATLSRYASEARSMVKGIELVHGRSAADPGEIHTPHAVRERVRVAPMELPDRERLERSFDRGSTGAHAVALSRIAGLRVSEMAALRREHIEADGSCVHVRDGSKGGRYRDIAIHDAGHREELLRLREATPEGGLLLRGVQADSIDRTLRRHMASLGMADKYEATTVHALRKTWAQERYDSYREGGATKCEAIRQTNKDLGHGEDRDVALLSVYVSNIW